MRNKEYKVVVQTDTEKYIWMCRIYQMDEDLVTLIHTDGEKMHIPMSRIQYIKATETKQWT